MRVMVGWPAAPPASLTCMEIESSTRIARTEGSVRLWPIVKTGMFSRAMTKPRMQQADGGEGDAGGLGAAFATVDVDHQRDASRMRMMFQNVRRSCRSRSGEEVIEGILPGPAGVELDREVAFLVEEAAIESEDPF